MTTVVITRADQIEIAIDKALEHIPLEKLVRGKLVAVKPNDTWASCTVKTGVTQPDTLGAVLRAVKKFTPRELVGTVFTTCSISACASSSSMFGAI